MSNSNFEQALTLLEHTKDTSKLLKLLINIRKEVDWPINNDNINKLRENGSLKYVVGSLQTSTKSILDVSLSILGNCCLDTKFSKHLVSQYNILSVLNQLLKRYPKEDSINGRIFRIIGNLCQHRDQWENVIIEKKPQIIIHTVKFLKDSVLSPEDNEKVSEATVIMAIRTLRELLNSSTLNPLIETYKVLNAIGIILIKYTEIWIEAKKSQNILRNIIKLLLEYSRYKFYPSITQMRNTEKGDSIIYLSKILLISPKQVVKIVTNFLQICQLKSDLPIPEIFDSIISILRSESSMENFSACEESIRCICQLLDHPGNRNNERCGDSIPLLINVLDGMSLRSNSKIECSILIISTLNKCKYNSSLILEHIKCNIISVLIEKLKSIVGPTEPLNIAHKSDIKRRNHFIAKLAEANKKRRRITLLKEEEDRMSSSSDEEMDAFTYNMRCNWSPASSSSDSELAMSWTSGLSPRSSPQSHFGLFESDSDDYSPICSEVDPNDFPLNFEDDDAPNSEPEKTGENSKEDADNNVEQVVDFETDVVILKDVKLKLLLEIVDLLKTYTKIRPSIAQLGTAELLLALVKSCGYFDWPSSSPLQDILDVIYSILELHDYLLPLMQTSFLCSVYALDHMQHGAWCSKCLQFQLISYNILRKMSKVAESDAGRGDIAHKLLRGDNLSKERLVLAIPFVIRNSFILAKLLMNCGGLEIIMKLLRDNSHSLKDSYVKVLYILAADRLKIPNPKNVKTSTKLAMKQPKTETQTLITLKLDDGSVLQADKVILSAHSDFFERLLNGNFKESKEDVITLRNVENKAMKFLLKFMNSNIDNLVEIDMDLSTHLSVIALCDRFLMPDCCTFISDCVQKFLLSAKNIPSIYQWSIESRTNILRVEAVAFALVGDMSPSERLGMFQSLFDLGHKEELVNDINKLLVRYLSLGKM